MDMITNVDKRYSAFEQNWTMYAEAILQYSSTAPSKTNKLKLALKYLCGDDDDDDGDCDDEIINNGMKSLLRMHAFNHSNLHFIV